MPRMRETCWKRIMYLFKRAALCLCAAGFASSENVIKNDYRWPAEYLSCWRDCCVRFASGQAVGLPHLRFYDWALRLTGISTMLVGATLIAIDRQ